MVEITHVHLNDILADNSFNCREHIEAAKLKELAKSIIETGKLLQPVVIRTIPESKRIFHPDKKWHLVAGYRRYHALKLLAAEDPKWLDVPVTVHECNDNQAFTFNLTENLQRAELNIKEEAGAVKKMLDLNMTNQEIAKALGKSMGWLDVRLKMCDLPEDIQATIVEFDLTQAQIKQIHGLTSDDARYQAVKAVKEKKLRGEKIRDVVKQERDPDKKVIPREHDKIAMMEKIAGIIGYGFHTRLLAWTNGAITDNELIEDAYKFKAEYVKRM